MKPGTKPRITRKQFLRNCIYTAAGSFISAAFSNCYFDMEYSPYETDVDHHDLNAKNLEKIRAAESKKSGADFYRIGLMSDTHHFFTETKKIVSIFNSRNDLDFVIILGDTTTQGLLKEFNWTHDVQAKLNYPYINIIGNHDCLDYGIEIFKKMYGPLNFSFSFLGTEFICFNNNNWESGDPDYAWLRSTASSGNAEHRILLAHIDNSNSAFDRFNRQEIDTFNRIVADYFDLTIHGHAHEESSEEIVSGVPRYIIGSPKRGHYMILTYDSGSFEVERLKYE